jgi:ATP-binding cassette, subfamily B, bacterial
VTEPAEVAEPAASASGAGGAGRVSGGVDQDDAPRPSARRLARLASILFFDGFRAAPGWMALVTTLLVLGSVAGTCYPLGYKLLADGALSGDAAQVTEGVAVVAGMLGLSWVLTGIGATEAMALSDRIAVYRTRRLVELISGVPTLEHLERHDYLAKVE